MRRSSNNIRQSSCPARTDRPAAEEQQKARRWPCLPHEQVPLTSPEASIWKLFPVAQGMNVLDKSYTSAVWLGLVLGAAVTASSIFHVKIENVSDISHYPSPLLFHSRRQGCSAYAD
ncbi:hypothetical protein AV530_001165 [Patagioenas fasciata monilis]|uniref:Uncharacterized protein n=1 Tax=Patagioenas fasciata monilis TaxID=372326 RepID=A0A1V4KTL5_PATFA|nr:hypothetical protein AV530_001165 [Patagioenas fasciata monilis]